MENSSFLAPIVERGIGLLIFTAVVLMLTGIFALAQSASGAFLPHDTAFLGMGADDLAKYQEGRINYFMFHDRVAYGGTLLASGVLYLWLALFPLRKGEQWAWGIFLFSGVVGFGSFFSYLGFGYLDTWHGYGVLLLFPFYAAGMFKSHAEFEGKVFSSDFWKNENPLQLHDTYDIGFLCLNIVGYGIFLSGLVIMVTGMTVVFVPQDLDYMRIDVCGLRKINEKLIPLIAHDRACFGGGLATVGVMLIFILRKSHIKRSLWEALLLTLFSGFSTAIGVHFAVGYTDLFHLAPAYFGAWFAFLGLSLTAKRAFLS